MKNNLHKKSPKSFDAKPKGRKYLFKTERYLPGLALCSILTEDMEEIAAFVCPIPLLKNTKLMESFLAELTNSRRVRICHQ